MDGAATLAGPRAQAQDARFGERGVPGAATFSPPRAPDIQAVLALRDALPPLLALADRTAIVVAVAHTLLWAPSATEKLVDGVLLGADTDALLGWEEIAHERATGATALLAAVDPDLPRVDVAGLSIPARQVLACSNSRGERVAKDPELLRRQVALSAERFHAALEELAHAGFAGYGDFAVTLASCTANQLREMADQLGVALPKGGTKARLVDLLGAGADGDRLRQVASAVDPELESREWWLVLPHCTEAAVARALGAVLARWLVFSSYRARPRFDARWTLLTTHGACAHCLAQAAAYDSDGPQPPYHLTCRCGPVIDIDGDIAQE